MDGRYEAGAELQPFFAHRCRLRLQNRVKMGTNLGRTESTMYSMNTSILGRISEGHLE